MNETGTKLSCETCNAQLVVTKGGSGEVMCCGSPMQVVSGKRPEGADAARERIRADDPFYD